MYRDHDDNHLDHVDYWSGHTIFPWTTTCTTTLLDSFERQNLSVHNVLKTIHILSPYTWKRLQLEHVLTVLLD